MDKIVELIRQERQKQDEKWGKLPRANNDNYVWLAILMEEMGEVSQAVLNGDTINLDEELIDVAAVAIAWLEQNELYRAL